MAYRNLLQVFFKKPKICKKTGMSIMCLWFIAFSLQAQTTILNKDFTGQTLPSGWSNTGSGTPGQVWKFNNPGSRAIGGNFDSDFAILDSDNYGNGNSQNATLTTAAFDASSYTSALTLQFDYQYRECCSSTARVQVYNGSSWTTVKTFTGSPNYPSTTLESIDILAAAGGSANAKVRFRYTGAWAWWLAIDNVKITGIAPTDSDGDGVADEYDLDDDNDGVTDTEELTACALVSSITGYNSATIYDLPEGQDTWNIISSANTFPTGSYTVVGTFDYVEFANTSDAFDIKFVGNLYEIPGTNADVTNYSGNDPSVPVNSNDGLIEFKKTIASTEAGTYNFDITNADDHVFIYLNGVKQYQIQNAYNGTPHNNILTLALTGGDVLSILMVEEYVFNTNLQIDIQKTLNEDGSPATLICDRDRDGVSDQNDLDSDNDGIPDIVEAGGIDVNGDGHIDYPTPNDPTSMIDLDGDGLADAFDDTDTAGGTPGWIAGTPISNPDTDGDGVKDKNDLDSDNDGIPDLIEAGGIDSNGDGLIDYPIANDATSMVDADGDGLADNFDPDDDGIPGVEDATDPLVKVGGDTNSDGFANDGANNTYVDGDGNNNDLDGDGIPNNKDLDSDGDGIPDLVEAGGIDSNGDGKVQIATDADGDGLADIYDADDDGTPGVEDATDPLMKTGGTDTDADGKADDAAVTFVDGNGNSSDTDGDGLPDLRDLDSDNDGIVDLVEVGGPDTDGDGKVDATADDDGDGLADVYDENASDGPAGSGTNGTALVETTVDTNVDGKVNGNESMIAGGGGNLASINQDSADETGGIPILPNHLDIDSDNDGITDNTEAQASDDYVAPLGADADGDGLDNAYDSNFSGGKSISPVNTDMAGDADFLDTDTDNDGINDSIEGHDTDGDGTADATSPAGNGGTGPCTTDADGDGLLDCYDNNAASADPTNGNIQPATHPNAVDTGADQDWRQAKCALCATLYAIQDGNGIQTTTHIYNSNSGKLEPTANTYGTLRTNTYCESGGWRYYYNPAEPTAALFAMKGDASDLDNLDYIEIKVGQDPNDRQAGTNNDSYSRLMNRDWFVKMKTPQVNPIDIRFYYPGEDYGANGYVAANTAADGFNLMDSPTFVWFKTSNWDTYDPTSIEADGGSVANANGFAELTPTVTADQSSGMSQTDGTEGVDLGNGKNYVQFNALTSFSGGTAGFGAGASQLPQALLPVELSRFSGRLDECQVELVWSAESEINFSHYELEKSFNGHDFNKIFSIVGGDGRPTLDYSYTDKSPRAKNYYRLKQVDIDGSYEYSKVIYIAGGDCLDEDRDITIYPNPVSSKGEILVGFQAQEGNTQFVVLGASGQPVSIIELDAAEGWNTLSFDVNDLPAGVYHLVNTDTGKIALFIVQ